MRWLTLALLCAVLPACGRERRETHSEAPFSQAQLAATTTVFAGGVRSTKPDPNIERYEKNAFHVSEGQRLYEEFNCVECHAHGGGGIGVPLIDEEWIYGSSSPQIVATLIQGRPNGMPSFRNLLTEEQMWQIAAYVRAMAGQVPTDVPPSRGDNLSVTPSLVTEDTPPPRPSNADAGSR